MKCKLLNLTPLWLVANSIRMSHDSHDKSDTTNIPVYDCTTLVGVDSFIGEKDRDLIKRIGVKLKHESVLEMCTYIFDTEMSTKTLLAFSRHRVGVSLTMRSTRYTTSKNKGKHFCQTKRLEKYTNRIMDIVDEAIEDGLSDDDISLLLPQDYVYRGQIQFNARSLRHFLKLRYNNNHAHWQIQELANSLVECLPKEHIETMFYDIVETKGE